MNIKKEENIIRDIRKDILSVVQNVKISDKVNDVYTDIAFNMYRIGYRKADEVRKETIAEFCNNILTFLGTLNGEENLTVNKVITEVGNLCKLHMALFGAEV